MTSLIHPALLVFLVGFVDASDKTWILGRHIFLFRNEMKSWKDAERDCENRNMYLAKVDSQEITDSLKLHLKLEVWIGANRISSTGYEWLDGTALDYTNWAADEPSSGDESCVLVQQVKEKTWNNYDCGSERVRFLCQGISFTPVQVVVDSVECSNKVIVKLQPHNRASNTLHRITVQTDGYETKTVFKNASGGELHKLAEMDLPPWTESKVSVTACKSKTNCNGGTKSMSVQNKGLPRRVERISVTSSGSFSCIVRWEYTDDRSKDDVVGYRVTWNETFPTIPPGPQNLDKTTQQEIDQTTTSYTFEGRPNRHYKVAVEAETCAGYGEKVWFIGKCITDSKGPTIVDKPILSSERISKNGTLKIKVDIPSQDNGKVSCLFTIVKVHDVKNVLEASSAYNINDLTRANTSDEEYIAIAYEVTEGTRVDFVLGNTKPSKCYVSSGMARRKKRNVNEALFVGRNPKLQRNETYSMFVVSATPTKAGFVVKASETVQMTGDVETNQNEQIGQSQTGVIAGSICGVILILIVLVVLLLFRMRGKKRKDKVEEPQYAGIVDNICDSNAAGAFQPEDQYTMAQEAVFQSNRGAPQISRRSETDILMKDFENVYNSMHKNKAAKFAEQFEEIARTAASLNLSRDYASDPTLKVKNRYKNILPFDTTRVAIEHSEDGYINACFVDGHETKRKFIATQGPMKKTVSDFWIMVVEQKCTEIVMLAKCVEGGKTKCEKYWPDLGDTLTFGEVKVSNVKETLLCGFICRSLKVTANWKEGNMDTMVSQFHFLRWPDHGFPITTSTIFKIHSTCMETWAQNRAKAPIVVHCSAGAGRTGTFIGYDILLNESKSVGNADVFGCVLNMRKQRMDMVQNCDQYILVHKLLLESHLFGSTDIMGGDVSQRFSDTRYQAEVINEQFKNLSRVKPMGMSQKNSRETISTYDRMAIKLYENGQDILKSLSASYVETYDESVVLLTSREPMKSNLDGFWKLLINYEVSTVVMITETKNDAYTYWNEQCFFNVSVTHEEIVNTTTIRKLKIIGDEYAPKTITHIHLKLTSRILDVQDIAKINESIRRVQTEVRESKGAALVHCKNGLGMSGVYCAITNLLERLKVEDRVDVFRAVKDLRDCKKGMIQTAEQFRLCHEAVLEYLRNFDTYSNFK